MMDLFPFHRAERPAVIPKGNMDLFLIVDPGIHGEHVAVFAAKSMLQNILSHFFHTQSGIHGSASGYLVSEA